MATNAPTERFLRRLGKEGPKIPAVGLGLANLAGAYGDPPSKTDAFAILDRALELGNIFWDTAEQVF